MSGRPGLVAPFEVLPSTLAVRVTVAVRPPTLGG
jgi:hypothetical protein